MVEIREVKTRKEKKEFVNFPLNLYKDCEYFVPLFYSDEMKLFNKNHYFNEISESVFYLAYLDGHVVGRIQGILHNVANKKWNQERVRFTRFDAIDNQEVANALFDAVVAFAKSKGMKEVVGPLGYSDMDREGLLIEGFNYLNTFEEQYNYEYYPKLLDNYGFEKDVDWVERRIKLPEVEDKRYATIGKKMLERYHLHFDNCKNLNEFISRYKDQLFDIIDKTYENLYGTVPLTDKMKQEYVKSFKAILSLDYVTVIVDENDKVVAFGLCFPSISKSMNKIKGKLFPFGFISLLKEIKHPTAVDLGLVGVVDEYKRTGVASALFGFVYDILKRPGIEYCETNLNLEDNAAIQNQWKAFDATLHKRRRSYVYKVK